MGIGSSGVSSGLGGSSAVVILDGWKCTELWPGQAWAMREAVSRNVSVEADSDGLRLSESGMGYSGGMGNYAIPASVLLWLTQAVRTTEHPPQ